MAVLKAMPSLAIIAGFKGKIDFYRWRGLPCARSWPRGHGGQRSPTVQATWPAFTTAAQEWSHLSAEVQQAWNAMAQHGGLSGRDLQVRGYLGGVYRYTMP